MDEDNLGGCVGLARGQADLPGLEQLTPAEHRGVHASALGEPLDEVLVVAAPGDVHRPHLAGAEAEAGGAHGQQQGGVVAGAPPARRPQVGAVGRGRCAAGRARGTTVR